MSKSLEDTAEFDTLRLSSPAELLAAIPYLVGFHPVESLVLVGLAGNRVTVTARLDLADCGEGELHHALTVVSRAGSDAILGAIYGEEDGQTTSWSHTFPLGQIVESLREAAAWHQLRVGQVLVVRDDRFWIYSEAWDEDAGTALRPKSSHAAASATYAGLVARPDRAALMAILDQDDAVVRATLDPLLAEYESAAVKAILSGSAQSNRRRVKRAVFAAARQADSTLPGTDPSADRSATLCRIAVGLTDTETRDAVWLAVDQGRLDGRSLWQELVRRLPSPYDAPALFLFGWASWREGNGVLAAEAAIRAMDSDPGYTAAELLLSAVQNGLDPHKTPRLRAPRT
jgi:Domain of unknown function (DUF4192)